MPNVNFTYELEEQGPMQEDTILLDVSADVSPFVPMLQYLSNGDPGYPAEGGEVEDLTVTLPDGKSFTPPYGLYTLLVEKAIEEAYGC